jgi:hypothetical protein
MPAGRDWPEEIEVGALQSAPAGPAQQGAAWRRRQQQQEQQQQQHHQGLAFGAPEAPPQLSGAGIHVSFDQDPISWEAEEGPEGDLEGASWLLSKNQQRQSAPAVLGPAAAQRTQQAQQEQHDDLWGWPDNAEPGGSIPGDPWAAFEEAGGERAGVSAVNGAQGARFGDGRSSFAEAAGQAFGGELGAQPGCGGAARRAPKFGRRQPLQLSQVANCGAGQLGAGRSRELLGTAAGEGPAGWGEDDDVIDDEMLGQVNDEDPPAVLRIETLRLWAQCAPRHSWQYQPLLGHTSAAKVCLQHCCGLDSTALQLANCALHAF